MWMKIDDGLHAHRKTRAVTKSHPTKSRDAAPMGLWVLAGSWAAQNRTDGWVPPLPRQRAEQELLPLWEHFGHIFRSWGYSVWVGILCAADYGVPQTRERCILMASRVQVAQPPVPTHSRYGDDGGLFGDARLPWVAWGEALGLHEPAHLRHPRGAGMIERHGPRDDRSSDEPAMTVTSQVRSWVLDRRTNSKGPRGTMVPTVTVPSTSPAPTITSQGASGQLVLRASNMANSALRRDDEPAPTLVFANAGNDVRIYPEGSTERGRAEAAATRSPESRLITIPEASVLQSFPADYPWSGSRTKAGQQVGNAVPPLLAAHVLAALTDRALEVAA